MNDQKDKVDNQNVINKINNMIGNQQNNPTDDFIEKLIDEKGFENLLPEVRAEIKSDMITRLDDFISARMISGLSDEDVLTFEKMLNDQKTEAEIQEFLVTHIPDFENFLTNTLMEFRGVYLGQINVPVVEAGQTTASNDTPGHLPPAPVQTSLNSNN